MHDSERYGGALLVVITCSIFTSVVHCTGLSQREEQPFARDDNVRQQRQRPREPAIDLQRVELPRVETSVPHRRRVYRRPVPTARPRPRPQDRWDVQWFAEYNFFGLGTIGEQSLRIRQAPLGAPGEPWPKPQVHRSSATAILHLADDLNLVTGSRCPLIDAAWRRVKTNVYRVLKSKEERPIADAPSLPHVDAVNANLLGRCDKLPTHRMVESYDLHVRDAQVTIWAREVWGVLRGLETFSQLVYMDPYGRLVINETNIHDFPKFPHRGILIDTSRHFITKDVLIQNLEAMAQNKMNVLHWHIVDDNSFPFQSKVFPNLTRFGAYNAKTHIYTHEDIAEVIYEASVRGIRVIPEFDTPGHTFSWGLGQDNLLTPCYDQSEQITPYFGPINPILKSTYRFLRTLFTEVTKVFPDLYIHLGGDEVPYECWLSNPYLKRFMQRNAYEDVKELLNLYEKRLLDIVDSIRRRRQQHDSGTIVWQEVFDDAVKLPPNTIVQIWKGDMYDVERVLLADHKVIFSTCWYLDYINYGEDWDKYYNCEMLQRIEGDMQRINMTNLLGGEACLWMEFADNTNLISRLWPRAAAVAERLWSSSDVNDAVLAAPRMEEHRCRMLSRGLPVGVASGPGYCNIAPSDQSTVPRASRVLQKKAPGAPSSDRISRLQTTHISDSISVYVVPLMLASGACLIVVLVVFGRRFSYLSGFVTGSVSQRLGVRRLVLVFLVFTAVWCLLTTPFWMQFWERDNRR